MRTLAHVIASIATSDGGGVNLRRSLGSQRGLQLDPFLMLDEFFSDDPADYLAGFPSHPHRGFETVTYMLEGHMRHEDHLGNRGDLGPGDVQWMTAARGIVHSEMPQQSEGRMHGFQLWLNLPAKDKMGPPHYRDIAAAEIPEVALQSTATARLIAGTLEHDGAAIAGPINRPGAPLATDPLYLDLHLGAGATLTLPLADPRNALLYPYQGSVSVGPQGEARPLPLHAAGVLAPGDAVQVAAGASGARLLVIAGRPLHEPVVQYGPFVMNTVQEIEQALDDYRRGRLAGPA